MEKCEFFNRLVILEIEESILLTHSNNICEIAYNDGSYTTLYRVDDNGYIEVAADKVYEDDELYCRYGDDDEAAGREKIMIYDPNEDEMMPFARVEWSELEHYTECSSEHGINTSYYDCTGDDIIEGECFKADNCIPQDYPNQEYTAFYMFKATDGREFYIKRTSPFYSDEQDDCFEFITKEEFEKFENR